jgi:glycosyltransferase involved in cell wall biosynthesis
VLTSEREGAPLALLEYMAAGRPIVATRVGGVPELARDGLEALLVPPGDDRALAAALERLLVDDELRTRLGRGAAARQADEFRLAGTVARIEALYEELLAA